LLLGILLIGHRINQVYDKLEALSLVSVL